MARGGQEVDHFFRDNTYGTSITRDGQLVDHVFRVISVISLLGENFATKHTLYNTSEDHMNAQSSR